MERGEGHAGAAATDRERGRVLKPHETRRGLDLRGVSEDIRVGVFQPGVRDSLPEKPWLQEMDLRGYGRELGSASVPCLVVRSGSTEMWFSPRFGLVRERRSGVYEREQVFFSSYR